MRTILVWLALLAWALYWQGFAQTALNYAATGGGCELDENNDGFADRWLRWTRYSGDPSWEAIGVSFSLSRAIKIEGNSSQEIRIQRTSGQAGSFIVQLRPIWDENTPAYFRAPVGTPLFVRGWIRTENLQNTSLQVLVISGQRTIQLMNITTDTAGWSPISTIVPLETDSEGRARLYFTIEVFQGEGAASGRIWIDGIEVLWTGFSAPQRVQPNPLKIAHYNCPVPDWQMLLDPLVDFIIAPLSHVQALSSYPTNAHKGVYVNAAQTTNQQPVPWSDLYGGYQFVLQNNPNWFLTRNGEPFSNPAYPYLWPVNIGLTAVQQKAIQRLNEIHNALPLPEWIFFDNAGSWWQCDQYPNRTDMLPRWLEYFQNVSTYVRQNLNRKVIVNSGSHAGSYLDGNIGTQWIQYIDGVMLEHAICYLGGDPRTFRYQNYRLNRATSPHTDATWWATLRAVNAYPNKKWIIVAMTHPNNNPEMFRYILASYFVMAHENTYLMVEARETNEANIYHLWVKRPEVWVPLGSSIGQWRVAAGTVNDASGALFARDFEHGVVLVNPTENQTYEYTLPRTYKNWDGQVVPAGTRIQVGPKTGLAFYAAPEITLTITPQQITALPGETVTFTVQYRNDGLVDATNVKVSIPLPEGLEFVSSSAGGSYLDRQIYWTLPSVRAGQSGTLTFQARVN